MEINGKVYEDVIKTRTFKTHKGVEVTVHTKKDFDGSFSINVDINSMGLSGVTAWLGHNANGTDEPDPILFTYINGKRAVISAPSELLAELAADNSAKSHFGIDRDAEYDRLSQFAVVKDGSYYLDYSICKVVKAGLWDASPYSCKDYWRAHSHDIDGYYSKVMVSLRGFYDAGLRSGLIDDMLKARYGLIEPSGYCATHPGIVYIVSEDVAKAIVSDMTTAVSAKKIKSKEEEYAYLVKEKEHGRVLPLKEKKAKAKEYDLLFNEGGEGYNPYHYYVSQEHYDEFMANYDMQKS